MEWLHRYGLGVGKITRDGAAFGLSIARKGNNKEGKGRKGKKGLEGARNGSSYGTTVRNTLWERPPHGSCGL